MGDNWELHTLIHYGLVMQDMMHSCTIFLILQVLHSHLRDDNILADVCDGSLLKEHPLSTVTMQFIIYFDEVEVCNPLGSYSGFQKLGLLYICNIRSP